MVFLVWRAPRYRPSGDGRRACGHTPVRCIRQKHKKRPDGYPARALSGAMCWPDALRHVRLEAIHNGFLRHRADDLVDRLAVLVDDHGRDVEDAELAGVLLVLVDVHLGDLDAVGFLSGDLLEDGADHATGAAPRGPEVHEDGLVGLVEDLGLVSGVGNGNWLGHVLLFLHMCYP